MSIHQTCAHPKADNATMQMPETIPTTMINLAKGKSQEIPPQGGSSADSNHPPLENIPIRAGTPWPRAGSMSENLFESRKKLANSPHTYIHPCNKSQSTAP